jgi:hypothetical protein
MANNGGGSGLATEVVRQASQRLRGVQGYVEGGTGSDVLSDVRSFARRRPGAFLLAAAAAGVLAGRATRGAAAARKAESETSQGYSGGAGYGSSYGSGYAAGYEGTTAGYRTGDVEPLTGTGSYSEGLGYAGGTAAGAPTSGLERTSDPNLAPTAGPYTEAGGNVLGEVGDPVPPDLGGRDTESRGTGETTGTGYEGTR